MKLPTIVVVTSGVINDPLSGYDLRVNQLVRRLSKDYRIVNVVVDLDRPSAPATGPDLIVPAIHLEFSRQRRLASVLRLTEGSYLARSNPVLFAQTMATIVANVESELAVAIVVFGAHLCSLIPPEQRRLTVVDICDSVSLIERRRMFRSGAWGVFRSFIAWARWGAFERWISQSFPVVFAASSEDASYISRGRSVARPLPNGIVPLAETAGVRQAGRDTHPVVAFWGNLDFEPNYDAIITVIRRVILRGLLPSGTTFRVIGKGAGPDILKWAQKSDQIEMMGFQPSLVDALGGAVALINYMRVGSGIKNKVLEAFSLGIVVISTKRGMQGFPKVTDGVHYINAETPAEFSSAIKRVVSDRKLVEKIAVAASAYVRQFDWDGVGDEMASAIKEVTSARVQAAIPAE